MFKFLHAADVHLDSPLTNLERYEGAPVDEVRGAARVALRGLVDLAIDERVNFVIVAGDLYDGDWRDHNTGLYFSEQARRLREAGIPLFIIAGNHDAVNRMTLKLRLPENPGGDSPLLHEQSAQTRELADLGVAIHGRSFGRQAETANIARDYPDGRREFFNIGLLHTSLQGSDEHARYAPCTLDDLKSKGYQYWALGHIHKRAVICEEPFVAFPGNLQGRHIRESGPKGCLLVQVDDRHRVQTEFKPLDVMRWETCRLPAGGLRSEDDVLEQFETSLDALLRQHGDKPLAVRLLVEGACPGFSELTARQYLLAPEIRNRAADISNGRAWVEKVKLDIRPERELDGDGAESSDELLACLRELMNDEQELANLMGEFEALRTKLRSERIDDRDALPFNDLADMRRLLEQTGPLLVRRLKDSDAS